jgi:hypothetical protein
MVANVDKKVDQEFWLFHNLDETELEEIRKFMDPELDLSNMEGVIELFHKLNHLLD